MPALVEAQRPSSAAVPPRRVAALVLPSLLCELAALRAPFARAPTLSPTKKGRAQPLPLGVILDERPAAKGDADVKRGRPEAPLVESPEEWGATSVLSAVNDAARSLGVREGQTLAEARALTSRLVVRGVPRVELEQGLAKLSEIALGFGAVAAFAAPDTVWVDVTGTAHLFGDETALAGELVAKVRAAGHRARVAIADGPLLAQAVARYAELSPEGFLVVSSERTKMEVAKLPVRALSLPRELESWFVRLGVMSIAELLALPATSLSARLGEHAARVLELARGRDTSPLARYEPPRVLIEEVSWDEPANGSEPLLFVLRGLVARLSARLAGRGEAAKAVTLHIVADPAIARFRKAAPVTTLEFVFPKPLYREQELLRIVSSRLERLQLTAPSLGLKLEVAELMEAMPRQLELGSVLAAARTDAVDELPLVLAELAADLGDNRVGVLRPLDAHRPELCSELVPALVSAERQPRLKKVRPPRSIQVLSAEGAPSLLQRLTRMLPEPLLVDAPLRAGATLLLDRRLYTIQSLHFEQRLEAVEWWSSAVNRDYVHVVLRGSEGLLEALMYVDRETGKRYLQGILD